MQGLVLRSGTELINPFKLLERVGIRRGWKVADMGCGATGHFVIPAAQLVGADGEVFAVDIRRDFLEHIERMAKHEQFFNIKTVWADMDVYGATRIPDGELDLCLLVNNLYLSQNRPALIREMARLTKPGGRILAVEWKATATLIGPPSDRRLTSEQSQAICQSQYMELIDEIDVGHSHYGLLYERTEVSAEEES
ncbi:MAG: methyltransferase domain-containing protein [Patescibacteria group bacterium]|nr:methyltransferase domain-containing protein [Patescibacteria group bacterium]